MDRAGFGGRGDADAPRADAWCRGAAGPGERHRAPAGGTCPIERATAHAASGGRQAAESNDAHPSDAASSPSMAVPDILTTTVHDSLRALSSA